MVDVFYLVGFEVWDVIMQDFCFGVIGLDIFCGVVFVGGFSYVDVLGFVKGWVVVVIFYFLVGGELRCFWK